MHGNKNNCTISEGIPVTSSGKEYLYLLSNLPSVDFLSRDVGFLIFAGGGGVLYKEASVLLDSIVEDEYVTCCRFLVVVAVTRVLCVV